MRAGIKHAVVCPGSRSTPLLVALAGAAERASLRLHVLADERSAGFFALGLALASGLPAPVVTTSGTAAAELHPAVLEAHHAGVPLLAVTADRPPELHDFGAAQTVHQVGLFGDATRWHVSPGPPELAAAWSWRSLAARSVLEARGAGVARPGPVHLNLAFREPLLGSAAEVLGDELEEAADRAIEAAMGAGAGSDRARALHLLRQGRPRRAPWHGRGGTIEAPPATDVVRMLAGTGERGLIVAGAGAGEPQAVRLLSKATGWPVLATPQSGCRLPGAIGSADALLRTKVVRAWQPDVVVRLGAPWASRVLNEWLASLDCAQLLAGPGSTWAAPDRPAGDVIFSSPSLLCQAVADEVRDHTTAGRGDGVQSSWARQWALAERLAQSAIDGALAGEEGLTEPGIARSIIGALPEGASIVVSSSMPIRDVEWWGRPRQGLRVLANRGANGIDGILSTALGVAASWSVSSRRSAAPSARGLASGPLAGSPAATAPVGGRVTALLGDLAFLYDAAALVAAPRLGVDLDVVVVDNDGGGIFNFLPQASGQPPARFEQLWGTPHGTDILKVARGYGVATEEVRDLGELLSALAGSDGGQGVRVLVAKTDRATNVAVHRRLTTAVEMAIEGLAERGTSSAR